VGKVFLLPKAVHQLPAGNGHLRIPPNLKRLHQAVHKINGDLHLVGNEFGKSLGRTYSPSSF